MSEAPSASEVWVGSPLDLKPFAKRGWLHKAGDVNPSFKKRFCVLAGDLLYYYRQVAPQSSPPAHAPPGAAALPSDPARRRSVPPLPCSQETDLQPAGTIHIQSAKIESVDKRRLHITPPQASRVYVVMASNTVERDEWLTELKWVSESRDMAHQNESVQGVLGGGHTKPKYNTDWTLNAEKPKRVRAARTRMREVGTEKPSGPPTLVARAGDDTHRGVELLRVASRRAEARRGDAQRAPPGLL